LTHQAGPSGEGPHKENLCTGLDCRSETNPNRHVGMARLRRGYTLGAPLWSTLLNEIPHQFTIVSSRVMKAPRAISGIFVGLRGLV